MSAPVFGRDSAPRRTRYSSTHATARERLIAAAVHPNMLNHPTALRPLRPLPTTFNPGPYSPGVPAPGSPRFLEEGGIRPD